MATNLLPSYLGNVVATRDRLSAIRQRIGLEPSATQMRELAPSPRNGPANTTSAQTAAVQEPDWSNIQIAPEKQQVMLTQAADFLQQFQPPQREQAAPPVSQPQPRSGRPSQTLNDQATVRAMAPLAEFFKVNGRLPNPNELRSIAAARMLEKQLGRKPTETEIQLFLSKPPKV